MRNENKSNGAITASSSEAKIFSDKKSARPQILFVAVLLTLLLFASVVFSVDEKKLADQQSKLESGSWSTYLEFIGLPNLGVGSPLLLLSSGIVMIIALAYMAASFLQLEELKRFSKAELLQAGVTVLIAITILSIILFTNTMLQYVAEESLSPCTGQSVSDHADDPLVLTYAYCYMNSFSGHARLAAKDTLRTGLQNAADAYTSVGYMTDRWYFLYAGFTMRPNAQKRLDSEINGLEFQNIQNSLISIEAQKFVLEKIIPTLGPAALFLGILLRALVYTRRLGGLLIACGLSLLLVWPATYLLAWLSLQSAVFGQQAISEQGDSVCPASCKIDPPAGYDIIQNPQGAEVGVATYSVSEFTLKVQEAFGDVLVNTTDVEKLLDLGLQPCYPDADSSNMDLVDSQNCPKSCRFLPTPINCDLAACTSIPNACKAIRQMKMGDPADNCIDSSQWTCSEKVCPEYCKMTLPQVQYDDPDEPYSYGGDYSKQVIPTDSASEGGACGKGNCLECSQYWRRYISAGGDYTSISGISACNLCLKTNPECMLGIPSLLGQTCDSQGACGQKISLAQWMDAESTGTEINSCPVDCRVLFGGEADQYRDKLFVDYCTPKGKNYISACESCPVQCKINASDSLGASATLTRVSLAGTGQIITCAEAPKFNPPSYEMDATVSGDCSRCPLSCRFDNPSSVKDINSLGPDAFLSGVHYALACHYYPLKEDSSHTCGAKISYSGDCSNTNYPASWYAYSSIYTTDSCSISLSQDEVPACAPAQEIYYGYVGNPLTCPKFIADSSQYLNLDLFDPDSDSGLYIPGLLVGYVAENSDVSGECASDDAIKFCTGNDESGTPYCPDSCKIDRQTQGPFYCSVDDIKSAQAKILSNNDYCQDCYALNSPDNTTGPQCQVVLQGSGQMIFPYGCSEYCSPLDSSGNLIADPKDKDASCNGFCYPQLQIPNCDAYVAPPTDDPNSRDFASCAACPLDCRYDYNASGDAPSIPAGANDYCVYDVPNSNKRNCYWDCAGDQPAPSGDWASWVGTHCEAENAYSCQEGTEGDYWVKNFSEKLQDKNVPLSDYCENILDLPSVCCQNVIEYDGTCNTYKVGDQCCGGEDCTTDWYEDICGADPGLFTLQPEYTPQSCTRGSKYPELDSLIHTKNSNYNECGDLSLTDSGGDAQNPDLHLCGVPGKGTYTTATGGTTVTICKNDPTASNTCYAHYNSLFVSCLPQRADAAEDVPPPVNFPHLANESCQQCPVFCRVDDSGTGITACDLNNWKVVGPKPVCNPENCDLSTDPPAADGDFGYCGVSITEFSLTVTGGTCQPPAVGEGIGCPARCRVLIDKYDPSVLPAECTSGDIGQACSNLIKYCRAETPSRLCQGCLSCQKDCLALPYVRQNCDELCLPSDNLKGRTDVSPSDLISSWNGAVGKTAWRNIASLAIASFVLPIFCILITLSFIRSLSPLLGGDIEIPGLSKLFR